MAASDLIALGAAIVALLAMGIAIWQGISAHRAAASAKNQANAAEDQAKSAKDQAESAKQAAAATEEQVKLLRVQVESEAEDRRDRLAKPARLVSVDLHGAVPSVLITNRGTVAIRDVKLVEIVSAAGNPVAWRLSPNIFGNRRRWPMLAPNDSATFAIDQVGQDAAAATVSFIDGTGRRWLRTGTDEPKPVN